MPKFIRTKDGIYETSQTISVDFKECYIEAYDTQLERWIKKNIINQSENLEELCDEFVITCVEDYEYKHFYPKIADINDALEYATEDVYIIYGAIWTSKGLIYVAKMNDKGELELI